MKSALATVLSPKRRPETLPVEPPAKAPAKRPISPPRKPPGKPPAPVPVDLGPDGREPLHECVDRPELPCPACAKWTGDPLAIKKS